MPVLGVPSPAQPGCPLVPTDMPSGQVALHVLALLSSCQDPQRVHALEQTLDLIRILQQKTDEEMAKLGLLGFGGLEVSLSPHPVTLTPFAFRGRGYSQNYPVQRGPGHPGPVPG